MMPPWLYFKGSWGLWVIEKVPEVTGEAQVVFEGDPGVLKGYQRSCYQERSFRRSWRSSMMGDRGNSRSHWGASYGPWRGSRSQVRCSGGTSEVLELVPRGSEEVPGVLEENLESLWQGSSDFWVGAWTRWGSRGPWRGSVCPWRGTTGSLKGSKTAQAVWRDAAEMLKC